MSDETRLAVGDMVCMIRHGIGRAVTIGATATVERTTKTLAVLDNGVRLNIEQRYGDCWTVHGEGSRLSGASTYYRVTSQVVTEALIEQRLQRSQNAVWSACDEWLKSVNHRKGVEAELAASEDLMAAIEDHVTELYGYRRRKDEARS